jgi:UDP-2,4-diacetamido-2,4,6-trideoxy-beta-L-altropyranose hydrolase
MRAETGMKIVFRVDASIVMGTGHVMRCRTLATALKKNGCDVRFITRAHPGHMGDLLVRDGFAVTLLPELACVENKGDDYAAWLGVSQQVDADQTIAAFKNQPCDWLIVDHYGLDRVWEVLLQSHTHKLMVIDDLANRPHECDMLLDQNYAVSGQARYQEWVPAHCRLLLGPRYALLRPEYAQYRETMVPRTGDIKRLLVFMGGADNANTTGKVLAALSTEKLAHIEVDIVIGTNFIHTTEVTEQANARINTHLHGPRPHLADLMANVDLALGAGGATNWERLCMGLPSLVLSVAENQVPVCEALASSGLIKYLGRAHDLAVAGIQLSLLEALAEPRPLRILTNKSQTLVDGLGANRVAEALNPTPVEYLKVRPAIASDALGYLAWVNDPVVRSSAINSAPIDVVTHLEWFEKRLKDVNSHLYVLEAGNLPVGQVRFERQDSEVTIDYSLDILVRGRSWAGKLIKLGIDVLNLHHATLFCASVKPENTASIATFIRLGFVEQIVGSLNENRHFQLPLLVTKNRTITRDRSEK